MRERVAILVASCALAASHDGRADDAGVLVSAGVGPSVSPMTWDGVGALDGMPLHLSTTRWALVFAVKIVPTLELTSTTSLGLGLGAVISSGSGQMGHTSFFLGGELEATARAAFRIDASTRLHVGAGPAMASFAGGGPDILSNDNVVDFETLVGAAADAAVVWDQFAIELRAGYLRGEHTTYIPMMLMFAWHWGAP